MHVAATAPYVTAWSIVEARHTSTGDPRTLADAFFAAPAIRSLGSRVQRDVVDLPCTGSGCNPLDNEMHQRAFCLQSLARFSASHAQHAPLDSDVLLVLDPDEVPSMQTLREIQTSGCKALDVVRLKMHTIYYDLGCPLPRGPFGGGGAKAGATRAYIKHWLRIEADSRNDTWAGPNSTWAGALRFARGSF